MELAKNIIRLRKQKGMTQEELGADAYVTKPFQDRFLLEALQE